MSWKDRLPTVNGRIVWDEPLAPFTWLRVGGPADALVLPADTADLAQFLKHLDPGVPVTVLGAASNTLVRDGGVEGVVVRLGRGFSEIRTRGLKVFAGAGAQDAQVARAAAEAGISSMAFFTGVPGTIGGACVMNAGCYGQETKDVIVEAYALTREGQAVTLSNQEMGFGYRTADAARGLIFTGALFEGASGDPDQIKAEMAEITQKREAAQPIREKTGGSTFKNPKAPDGELLSAWRLVDQAGWRGKPFGQAMMSPKHANFMINIGEATASDLEGLGEAVRADVAAKFGVTLEWEIKRVGHALS